MLLRTIYRKIPFEYAIVLKEVYRWLYKIYLKLFNFFKYGNSDMFNNINIETTTCCNRRCSYCPNSIYERSLKKNENLMSEEMYIKIINDLKKIKFTGRISPHFFGEPLIDERLVRLMKFTHDILPKVKLVIFSNADPLDTNLLEKLYNVGVSRYVITLHGNEKHKEKIRNKINDLKKFVKINKLHIDFNLINFTEKTKLSNRGGLVKIKETTKKCSYQNPTNPLVINYKGDVLLCCNDYFGSICFGNITTDYLLDIWNRDEFKKIRKEISRKIFKLDICKKCLE
jgi:radical SAM protein with 4Fe4S-binding SPASM domain